ncbi:MAG: hypothetical protein JEY99_09660 [Spirochaetales bacterium]|nr:hypothetical protein [Spirochaetales bacterium]
MRKIIFIFISSFLLTACVSRDVPPADAETFPEEILQQSVVNTSFDDSVLYGPFRESRIEGPVIPGLLNPLVPQGMAYWEEHGWMIISNYMSDDSAGVLSILNMEVGSLHKVLSLYNADRTPHRGHLGGLALSREHLWVASETGIYFIKLSALLSTEDRETIFLSNLIETETKGSFATFTDGVLWIGEFTRKDGSYPSSERHHHEARDKNRHRAWLAGYKLKGETDMLNLLHMDSSKLAPDFILSIPDDIQGALILHNKIFLSASYGRKNYSRVLVFKNPLTEEPHRFETFFTALDVPLWYLDDLNKIGRMVLPPMSEALVFYEDSLAVLFESAASKYRATAKFPVDRIQLFPLEAFETPSE